MNENKNSIESMGYTQELKRTLKMKDLVVFGIVSMSPQACMTLFGSMTQISQGHSVFAYLIGFVAMLLTAFSYGKMIQAFPVAGSTYSYTQKAIDSRLGFISGWLMLLDYVCIPLLLFIISANFSHALIPQVPYWTWVIIYTAIVTIINITGVEVAAKANFIITGIMILGIVSFIVAAAKYILGENIASNALVEALYNSKNFSLNPVVSASALAVLSYLGFDAISTVTEEAAVSPKKVGYAIVIACVIQTIIFISVAYFATLVTPNYASITNTDTAFFEIAFTIGGAAFQTFLTLIIMVTSVATALAGQIAASRLLFGMGRDNLIPSKVFAYLSPKYKTPTYSILIMSFIGFICALILDFNIVSEIVTFGGLFGFICVNSAVVVHCFIKNKDRKVLSNLIFPIIGAGVCFYIWISLSSVAKIVGFTWMTIGIVYLAIRIMASKDFKVLLENVEVKA